MLGNLFSAFCLIPLAILTFGLFIEKLFIKLLTKNE